MSVNDVDSGSLSIILGGEEYEFRFSLAGNRYLSSKYGTPTNAMAKYFQMLTTFLEPEDEAEKAKFVQPNGFTAEQYDLVVDLLYAGIVHASFDKEIPSPEKLFAIMNEKDMGNFFTLFTKAQASSLPEQKKSSKPTPQKASRK